MNDKPTMEYYQNLDNLRRHNTTESDLTIDLKPYILDMVTIGELKSTIATAIKTYEAQLEYVYIDAFTIPELDKFKKELERIKIGALSDRVEIKYDSLPRTMSNDLKNTIQLVLIRRCNILWGDITRYSM